MFDKEDKLTGFLKITRDLTDKKELEEKLKKLNEGLEQQVKERTAALQKQFKELSDYKFALDESSIVAITDLKGIILHANDNFCKISKYTQTELIGQDHRIVNSGYHSKEFIRDLWVTIANGKIWKGEIKNKAKDGTTYWVDTTIVPFLSEAGKPTRYIAIRVDITRQKEIKEKLIASEQFFHATMDNMLEAIQMHDFDWRYTYVNEAHRRYSGLAPEEVLGYSLTEKYPGIEQSDLFKTMNRCMTERVAERLESEFVFPDGRKTDFQLSIQPIPEGIVILSVDITERKKVERELQKMNRLYAFISAINQSIVHIRDREQLLNNACTVAMEIGKFKLAWIGLLDQADKLRVVSSKGERNIFDEIRKRTGLSIQNSLLKDAPVGKVLRTGLYAVSNDVLNDADISSLKEELLETGIKANIVFPLRKSGKVSGVFSFSADTVNAFDEQEIMLLQEAANDISFALEILENDKLRAEMLEQLKVSEGRLAQAQAVTKVGSWQTDLKTLKVFWSRETYRIFELDPEQFQPLHTSFLEFVHPEDRPMVDEAFKNSAQHSGLNRIEHRIVTTSGKVKQVEERWEILHGDTGEPVMASGTCQDITARINAMEKIKQSEENYRFLFNNNPAFFIIWDLETLQVKEVNDKVITVYGYSKEEWKNMSVLQYRPKEDHEKIKTFAKEMLVAEKERIAIMNWRHIKKNGEEMLMEISSHKITYNGRPCILSLAIDVTERQKAEQEKAQLNKQLRDLTTHLLQIREEERAHISRELHDELGQQLTGIKMDMVWMGNKLTDTDTSTSTRVSEALQLIDETANTLRRINSDLRPEILDDLGLYAAIDLHCDEFAKRTGIKCTLEEEEPEPLLEKNISINIFRIFQEALNNVAKHASATEVKALVKAENGNIELTITDNGKGFDKQQAMNKKTYGLLGIKERVVAINGQLQIESAAGRGASIHVVIPVSHQPTSL